jgi:hypothetical protein
MKAHLKYQFAVVLAAPVLVAGGLIYGDYAERQAMREEETLKKLDVGSFSVENASVEAALKLIVEKVHARGHPEVRLRIYSDAKKAPFFHRELKPEYRPLDGPHALTITLGENEPLTLGDLLRYVGRLSDSTCDFRGHDLVVVPAVGTMERFRRRSYEMPSLMSADGKSLPDAKSLLELLKAEGFGPRYEGMTIGVGKKNSVVFYGPASEDPFEGDAVKTPLKDRLRFQLINWRMRLFGY